MATKIDERAAAPSPRSHQRGGTPWWEWALRLLPAVAFLATFGFFFVDKNEQARNALTSGRGFLTMAALVAGYLVIGFALRRYVRWAWVAPVVLTGVILALAAWVVLPSYRQERGEREIVTGEVRDASDEPEAPAGEPGPEPPAAPVRVAGGSLQGLAGHDASGTVSLIRQPDGSLVVRFENFDIEGTPDPRVHLIQGADQQSPGGTEIGGLEAEAGAVFDYVVPAGTDADAEWTVLVWCRSFGTPIGNATLAAA